MRAVRLAFPDGEAPIPEILGWRVDGEESFIYMGLVRGECQGVYSVPPIPRPPYQKDIRIPTASFSLISAASSSPTRQCAR